MSETRTPSYRRHKASGQAVFTLNGKDIYLGTFSSKSSRIEYDRVISEWLAAGRRLPGDQADLTIAELIAAYWKHAQAYYAAPQGYSAGELKNIRVALRRVREM